MTDRKTSQFPYTSNLAGDELIGVVQGGVNYQTTVDVINGRINNQLDVRIGHGSNAGSTSTYAVAIGYNANAETNGTMAIGYDARSFSNGGLAIGYEAFTMTSWCTAIGYRSYARGESSIAIGHGAATFNNTSTAIGWYSHSEASYTQLVGYSTYAGSDASHSAAFGSHARVFSQRSVAIGHNVEVQSNCDYGIAIGERAYIGRGDSEGTCANNIAIGKQASAAYTSNVAIGYQANYHTYRSVRSSTVVGGYAYSTANCGTAIGYDATAKGVYGVAVGAYASATAEGAVAIGTCSAARYGVSIGWESGANAFNSVAIAGAYAGYAYSTIIGRNAHDCCIGSFVTRGQNSTGMPLIPTDHVQRFFGITTTGNQTVVLTADGNSANSAANVPAMDRGSVTRLTGTVIGYLGTDFDNASDTACFVLDPLLVIRLAAGPYTFVGTPTFTMENSTEGASGWAVPTLTFDSGSNSLFITVNNDAAQILWMGFMRFEASR